MSASKGESAGMSALVFRHGARLRPLDGTIDISTGRKGTTISVRVRG